MIIATVEIIAISHQSAENWAVFSATAIERGEDGGETRGNTCTCSGVLPVMSHIGDRVEISGTRVQTAKYGQQVKCSKILPVAPDINHEAGVIKLLCRLRGVGEATAKRFYAEHGADSIDDALCNLSLLVKPEFALDEIEKLQMLVMGFEHFVYLLGIGLTNKQADTIYREYGAETTAKVRENAYILTEIHGLGFLKVDKIAIKAGIAINNPARTQACIKYCLQDSQLNGGNTSVRGWALAKLVAGQLHDSAMKSMVKDLHLCPDEKEVRSQAYLLAESGAIVIQDGKVYDRDLYDCEGLIFDALNQRTVPVHPEITVF